MNWSDSLNNPTLHDGFCTYTNFFASDHGCIEESEFIKLAKQSTPTKMTIEQWVGLNAENAGYERLNWPPKYGFTPEDAYPVEHRDRGERDVESVRWHMRTDVPISPILCARVGDKIIKLDGVHRAAAASIIRSRVSVVIVDLTQHVKKCDNAPKCN